MRVKRTSECVEIVANDDSRLRELWHPERGADGLPYSVAVASVAPSTATARHRLLGESELYYVIRGSGRMHVDDESTELGEGDSVIVPAGAEQWLECTGAVPLEVLLVVSPPWNADHDVRSEA